MSSHNKFLTFVFALTVCLITGYDGMAQEWSRFRGPNGTGIAAENISIPTEWKPENIQWKIPLSGAAHSSPVLWGDRLFVSVTEDEGNTQVLIGVNAATGQILWKQPFRAKAYGIHQFNSLSSPTAAASAEHVFFTWGTPENIQLVAMNHDGQVAWKRELGSFKSQHGYANSPIVEADKVIIANDQLGNSYLAAYDTQTGREIWKLQRNTGDKAAYSTPCLFEPQNGKPYLVFNSSTHGITGVDPESGALLWELNDLFDKRSVSSPVFSNNLVFGSCGSGGGGNYVVAVTVPDLARVDSKPKLAFRIRRSAPYVPTPVVKGKRAFLLSDQGIASMIDLTNGDTLYSERTNKRFFGSPVLVGDFYYAIATDGDVVVIRDGDEFELVATNPLGAPTHSTPAVANNAMFVRTNTHLICIAE